MPVPRTPRSTRTLTAATGALALGSALLVGTPAPAHALPLDETDFTVNTDVRSLNEGPGAGECTVTLTGGEQPDETFAFGQTKTLQSSALASITNNTDPTDTVSATTSTRTSLRATAERGVLSRFTASGTATATVDAALGSDSACRPRTETGTEIDMEFDLVEAGWVTIDIVTTGDPTSYVELDLEGDNFGRGGNTVGYQSRGRDTMRFYAVPDTYEFRFDTQLEHEDPHEEDVDYEPTVRARFELDMSYAKAGSASSRTSGPARRSVKLPSGISCGNGTLKLTFTKAATKAEKAQVKVNGKRLKTVRNPRKGQSVVLKKLAPQKVSKVAVVLDRTTATRSYLECS